MRTCTQLWDTASVFQNTTWGRSIPRTHPASLTHRLGPWAFSFGALGGRGGWHQGGSPRSRAGGCSGGPAAHCPGPRAARLLPVGEPGPEKGRGSGPRPGQRPPCTRMCAPREQLPRVRCGDRRSPCWSVPPPLPSSHPHLRRALLDCGSSRWPPGHLQTPCTLLPEQPSPRGEPCGHPPFLAPPKGRTEKIPTGLDWGMVFSRSARTTKGGHAEPAWKPACPLRLREVGGSKPGKTQGLGGTLSS